MRLLARRLAALVVAVVLGAPAAHAQLIVDRTFTIAFGPTRNPALAVGTDGNVAALWTAPVDPRHRGAFVRIFTPDGVALASARRVDDVGHAYDVDLAADPAGGYAAVWNDALPGGPTPVYGAILDGAGGPRSATFAVGTSSLLNGVLRVGSSVGGPVVLWSAPFDLRHRLFSWTGVPRGDALGEGQVFIYGDLAMRPDDGFVAAWWGLGDGRDFVRFYDSIGLPIGDAFPVSGDFVPVSIATDRDGGFVVAGLAATNASHPGSVCYRRFDANGTPVGSMIEVHVAGARDVLWPEIALDVQGNAFLAWATYDLDTNQSSSVRARAFDAADVPLGPMQEIGGVANTGKVRVTSLPDGRFATAWTQIDRAAAAVVSLCTPGVAVCGDGVLHPQCEHCGDGVADGGEECDDGNVTSCDGCSQQCRSEPGLVCGDGITNTVCGETCDDGNDVVGDGCGPSCALERIPGGGGTTTDCFLEWQVNNPANAPFLDKKGAVNARQTCVDDDPRCDFDGGAPGRCTFRLRACINNTDLAACLPGTRLASFEVRTPTEARAAKDVAAAATRSALLGLQGAIVGPDARDLCSQEIEVTVPLRGGPAGAVERKLVLGTSASLYDGRRDKDKLQLTCLPSVP